MPPAWRLATNSLSGRRSRTALLIAAVALSAALIVAVSCALASVNLALAQRVRATVGAADLRIRHVGGASFDAAAVDQAAAWPEVAAAVGRAQEAVALRNPRTDAGAVVVTYGIEPAREYPLRPQTPERGRPVEAPGEIALDALAARELGAELGDVLEVERFGTPITLRVTGVIKRPALGMLARPEGYVVLETLGSISDRPGRVREVDILLREGRDPEAVASAHRPALAESLLLQPTEKITSGLNRNLQSNQIGLVLASTLAFMSAAFIIMTGLTTSVTERQRELAVLRSIGATRAQLAWAQILVGVLVGGAGAVLGAPLGIGAAAALVAAFPEQLPGGFGLSWLGVALACLGSVGAGILGAAWPAATAARTSPLAGLGVRARPVRRGAVTLVLLAGLALIGLQLAVVGLPRTGDVVFWGYLLCGAPAMLTGYFLLGVPATLLMSRVAAPVITSLFRLPRRVLARTVAATPFRHGFTAGAMMVGLALMVSIWTNGRAILRDWLGALEFPDAFVHGLNLTEETQSRIEAIPGVRETCAITLQSVETDAFGVRGLGRYRTTFLAFEPREFFAMTNLTWLEGDLETAARRLEEGGAILVAREFRVTRGLGVGDTITFSHDGRPTPFEIVGVVTSPGLDVVSKYFDIGEEYLEQAVNSVFGSRNDLKDRFGNDAINLIQIDLADGADDADVMNDVRRIVGAGIISAGSGRQIKNEISGFIGGSLLVFSVVGVGAMLVACFGVANLIVAGIQARQFEFGVLRAVGAERSLLARLVLAEALVIALTACVLGTLMGIQASWAGQRLYEVMIGLLLRLRPPVLPIAAGWLILIVITLGAAGPAAWALMRRSPRELLAAVKG